MYIQAFIRDPKNTVDQGGSFGGTLPSLNPQTVQSFLGAWQGLDAFIASSGLYGPYNINAMTPITDISAAWMTFVANQAQLTLKKDFFSLVPFQQIFDELGIGIGNPILFGTDLQSAVQTVISGLQDYANGNYAGARANVLRPGRVPLVKAHFYQGAPTSNGQLLQAGGAVAAAGAAVLNIAGGTAALGLGTSGVTASGLTIAAAALGWTGVGLIVLGAGVAGYAVYRIATQKNGTSGPWAHPDHNPGDPPYLQRLNARPSLFPPLLPPSPQPNFEM